MSVPPDPGRQAAIERLDEWARGLTVSAQSHLPVYPNPAALKADILLVLAAFAAAPPSPPLIEAIGALPHHPNCASFSMGGWPEDGASFCDCPKRVALAAARGETREADARLAAMETENAKLEAYDDLEREEPSDGR